MRVKLFFLCYSSRRAFNIGRRLPRLTKAVHLEKTDSEAELLKEKFRRRIQLDPQDTNAVSPFTCLDKVASTLEHKTRAVAKFMRLENDTRAIESAQTWIHRVFQVAGIHTTEDLAQAISSGHQFIAEDFSYLYTKEQNDFVHHQIVLSFNSVRRRIFVYSTLLGDDAIPKGKRHSDTDWLLIKMPFGIFIHILSPERRESIDLEGLYSSDAVARALKDDQSIGIDAKTEIGISKDAL